MWSVALYGCETWTVTMEEKKRLEAFEQWCYRRMLKIGWKDRVTNEEARRTSLIGHTLRHDNMLTRIVEGMVEGKRYRGRPRFQYIQQIMGDVNCRSYLELKRKAGNRADWRAAANQSRD